MSASRLPPIPPDDPPGVPGFRSWRAVYAFVLGYFVLVVVLLTVFSHIYG